MFTSHMRPEGKSDFSDFDQGMVVGTRQVGLGILKTADLLEFSFTTVTIIYKKQAPNGSSVGRHGLLLSDEQNIISKYERNQPQPNSRPHLLLLLSAKHRKLRPLWAQSHSH